jgi:superfamily II DNA or RNA helicase
MSTEQVLTPKTVALWKQYEFYVCSYHRDVYDETVWHTDVIPEEILEESGLINDYNRHRLLRIARKRRLKGMYVLFSDYGVDFVSRDEDGVYHFGQAKYYTNKKVCGNDVGTFLSVVLGKSDKSYLYTTSGLTPNLRDQLLGGGVVEHVQLDFNGEIEEESGSDEDEEVCRQEDDIEEIDGYRVDPDNFADNEELSDGNEETEDVIDETTLELRPYQVEALEFLNTVNEEEVEESESGDESDTESGPNNRKILELFCGSGKTLICGHHLAQTGYDLIICIAPLRVSVDQLELRLTPFIPEYEPILIDSDGTTDIQRVRTVLKCSKKLVIYSTYRSTENLLCEVIENFSDKSILIVDEVHNMLSNEKLCEFATKFTNAIFLSATIPEDAMSILKTNNVHTYGLGKAIENKYVCDYKVYLPYLSTDDNGKTFVDVEIPKILGRKDPDISAKAMFLATSMLKTGSRRCIVYLSSQKQCDVFLEVAKIAFENYQACNFIGWKIDANTSHDERWSILKKFQASGNPGLFRIITSVRILDEAIDVVKCDSEFICSVGEGTSDIRTIQRLCRGCRLDKDSPNKVNNLFIWADEWNKALNCLRLLREADPEFTKKIRCIESNYDKQGIGSVKMDIENQIGQLGKYINIQCLSLEQRWELNRRDWEQYCIDHHGKRPPRGMVLGNWAHTTRIAHKNGKLSRHRIDALDATKYWVWTVKFIVRFFEQSHRIFSSFVVQNGRQPFPYSKDPVEKRLGIWVKDIRRSFKKGTLNQKYIDILSKDPNWLWTCRQPYIQMYIEWKHFYEINRRYPSSHSNDPTEKKLGNWVNTKRKSFKNGTLEQGCINILNKDPNWCW